MDATIHYASNGDSDADASYLRNLPIITVVSRYIDLNDPRYVRYQFDFGREEVHLLEKQEI